jgi:hypothetical protein
MTQAWILFAVSLGLALPFPIRAQEAKLLSFELFPGDPTCACIRTVKAAPGVRAVEKVEGERILQVFEDSKTGRGLFRFVVGQSAGGEEEKFWNYGIAARGDFNGDGVEDYSWYGADDARESRHMLLSSPSGYRRIDVIDAFETAWQKKFGGAKPDFGGGDFGLDAVRLERGPGDLSLIGSIVTYTANPSLDGHKLPVTVRVTQADFVIEK